VQVNLPRVTAVLTRLFEFEDAAGSAGLGHDPERYGNRQVAFDETVAKTCA
jgi:hypothetical protein